MATRKGKIEPLRRAQQFLYFKGAGSPLLVHRFASKAIFQILGKQMQLASSGRDEKEPEMDFVRSLHLMPKERFALPARAWKSAIVRGAKHTEQMPMTDARQAFFVRGEHVPTLFGTEEMVELVGVPEMHMAMVRTDNGGADVRFRGLFPQWAARLAVEYNAARISLEQIGQMAEAAGFGVGLAEDRGERGGNYGTFTIASKQEYDALVRQTTRARAEWFRQHAPLIARVAFEDRRLLDLVLRNPEALAAAEKAVGRKPRTARASDEKEARL